MFLVLLDKPFGHYNITYNITNSNLRMAQLMIGIQLLSARRTSMHVDQRVQIGQKREKATIALLRIAANVLRTSFVSLFAFGANIGHIPPKPSNFVIFY